MSTATLKVLETELIKFDGGEPLDARYTRAYARVVGGIAPSNQPFERAGGEAVVAALRVQDVGRSTAGR